MQEESIKELLYQAIEKIDDEKLLSAVYTILSSAKEESDYQFEVSEETLAMLKARESKYLNGEENVYTIDQVKEKIAARYGL